MHFGSSLDFLYCTNQSADIVHLKLVSHISPRVDISVSQTVQMISVQNGWGPREMVWCQNETNLDVVG